MDYLKVGKASDLEGTDRKIYRVLEILPGFLSWGTLVILILLSYYKPVFVAYFLIAFDIYWLLLVLYLGIYLLAAYKKMKASTQIDWQRECESLPQKEIFFPGRNETRKVSWQEIWHVTIFPTYNESVEVIRPSFQAMINDSYPKEKMIMVLAIEERGGPEALQRARQIESEFAGYFHKFIITIHPDNIEGELKGKGANQAWAARELRPIVEEMKLDIDLILVSVFDIDTIVHNGYFHCLTHKFLTVKDPHRASYQPIPVYHNNVWQAPFFARVAASSNTFWQMMQQIRQEKLATYSSHSMTWRALLDIGFWSTRMVSEDSRIFWHCLCYYKGDYRVEPLYFPVSMDVCMDDTLKQTMVNLYKQQRRWGWGVENLPYVMFNVIKKWKEYPKKKFFGKLFIQIYGFHSWATNALIIAVVGWLPMLLGGDRFNSTVLSNNLPGITRSLMTMAMGGMVLSAILSTLLLPPKPKKYGIMKNIAMLAQWLVLPVSIIFFGSIPGLEAQTRLMLGKYMGFWITPKAR